MVTCSNCHWENRVSAFFCKNCGHPLVCPRCRVVLLEPANYCDNCGQALALDGMPAIAPYVKKEVEPAAEPKIKTASEPVAPVISSETAPSDSQGARLDQFVPHELMAKLEAARSSGTMVGERRVVTILFCDVKGSTAAAEQLDPEDWTEIINGAFEHMIKPVYDYEGTVARLMGDGILAFFGAPITHEDDPQRAILAGLDIVTAIESYMVEVENRWGIEINVRVGINTGRVVVGAVGSDLRMEYTAMGDAINLASRMEQTASPGTVQVAYDTYKIVAPLFEFEELGSIEVKGKSEPVQTYRVLRPKASPGRVRGIEGLEIDLIGRDLEIASLDNVLVELQRGVGRIVCVIGEAGLGKSRLVRELRSSQSRVKQNKSPIYNSATDPQSPEPDPQWIETASLSYESAQPYALFRRLIRRVNGINHNDSQTVVREKLAPLTNFFEPEQQALVSTTFEALFGLTSDNEHPPLEGEAFKRALFELMPILWRKRFANQPTVIVYDDIHWSDPASIALLHDLLPLIEEMAMVFICVFRPNQDIPGWQIKNTADDTYHHRYTEVNLRPLSDSQSLQMINALLGNPDLPADLRRRILERADGNPFYIEEVIRTLIDGGAIVPDDSSNGHPRWLVSRQSTDIHIPDNLQALLTARIDNLSEEVRQTLQLASVIGRNFYRRVLKLINEASDELDNHIHTLLRQDMIRESARVPEIEYRFRNPLTQEAAYRTILLKRRREFHLRVGEIMETLFEEQLEEQAPQLAYHFREARQFNRAMLHFRQAGDTAFRLFANLEASTQYGYAIEMARQSDEPIATELLSHLFIRRGRALEHQVAYESALDNYQEMLAYGEERQDHELSLAAMMAMATVYSLQISIQDIPKSQALSKEALSLAQSLGDRAAEAKINWNLMNTVAFSRGEMEEGLAYGDASLQIAREMDLREQIAYTLNTMALIYWNNNRIAKGQALLEEVRAIWLELNNQPMLADASSMAGYSFLMTGDYRSAIESFTEVERISEAINNSWNLSNSKVFLGLGFMEIGAIDKGLSYLDEAIEISEQSGLNTNAVLGKVFLAGGYAFLGDFDRASSFVDEAFAQREEILPINRPLLLGLMSSMYVRCGGLAQAQSVLEEIVDYDRRSGSVWFASFIISAEAELSLAEMRAVDALNHVEPHIPRMREAGVHSNLSCLLFLQGQAYLALDEPAQAFSAFKQALAASELTGEHTWRMQILAALLGMEASRDPAMAADRDHWQEMASETVAYIVENTSDGDLRSSFLSRPDVMTLVGNNVRQ